MSDNMSNQNASSDAQISQLQQNDVKSQNESEYVKNSQESACDEASFNNSSENKIKEANSENELSNDPISFVKLLESELGKHIQIKNDQENYLKNVLNKYNSTNYFQNDSFKNLYKEAFNLLGTDLDTEKFINLLDDYVKSRIDLHSRDLAAIKENDSMTDKFDFKSGAISKNVKIPRMQDLSDDELAKYIAKYV